MKFPWTKGRQIPILSLKQKFRVCSMIARLLRNHSEAVAAIGVADTTAIKRFLTSGIVEKMTEVDRTDIVSILALVTGHEEDSPLDAGPVELLAEFRRSWRHNKLEQVLPVLLELGIISQEDWTRWSWIKANWK